MRISHKRSPRYDKKFTSNQLHLESIISIKRVNENQQVVLMRINKSILLRNKNDNRFQSHQSTANLKSRTQSTTIPNYASPNLLYIYKKWKCVESLTVTRKHVDRLKSICQYGYINQFFATPIVHSSLQSIRGGREFQLIRIARLNGWAG